MVRVWVLLSALSGCIPFSSCQEALGPPVTNCPDYVYEGQLLRCDCLPPANLAAAGTVDIALQWAGSLPGHELSYKDVKRKNSSQTFTCMMLGPVQRNTTYTLKFASGPESTRIIGPTYNNLDTEMTLTCEAFNVTPGAIFNWTGVDCLPVDSPDTMSTCRFVPGAGDDGKVITCEASNSEYPGQLSVTTIYTLNLTYGQEAGNVELENCNEGFIDIRENANNTIKCKGFNGSDIIGWAFQRNDENKSNGVATCYATFNCTVNQPDHFAVERSPSHSTLFYQQYDRQLDKGATVTCASLYLKSTRSKTCSLNVINQAKLSSCTVKEDRDSMTVIGSCRFEHAYSYKRDFYCTWYQKKDGMSRPFSGKITYESGSQNSTGWCTFTTTWEPGTSTYSINFYPGPGNITVNVGNIESSLETQDEIDLPIAAIVGGIVASVTVIIIIVVVFISRKRRQKATCTNGSGDVASKENNDFEEHVNPMYVTSDNPDDTHSTDHKPSAIAVWISSNSHNGHPAAPHSLDADMYTTVDGEARFVPSSAADRSGGYEDIDFGSNGNKRVPQKDEYAVVDKSRAKKGPASSENTNISSAAHPTEGSDEYAVVDKSSSRAEENVGKPSSDKDATQRSAADDDEYHTLSHTRGSPLTQDQADLESHYSHIGHD